MIKDPEVMQVISINVFLTLILNHPRDEGFVLVTRQASNTQIRKLYFISVSNKYVNVSWIKLLNIRILRRVH